MDIIMMWAAWRIWKRASDSLSGSREIEPIEGSHCHEQETLSSLLSTDWFKELIRA